MQHFTEIFSRIKSDSAPRLLAKTSLVCTTGFYTGCPVLKLQKASWTNDELPKTPSTSGLFFSIWISEKGLAKNQVSYNIHALKIKDLNGYQIKKSREFASDFRSKFQAHRGFWPNVGTDYGPQTLMEGWIRLNLATFEKDTLNLMRQFVEMHGLIDALLDRYK